MDRTPEAEEVKTLDYNDQNGLHSVTRERKQKNDFLLRIKDLEKRAERIERMFAAFVPAVQKELHDFRRHSKGAHLSAEAQFCKLKP